MAFGDLFQAVGRSTSVNTTHTASLGSPASAGNLLVVISSTISNSATFTSVSFDSGAAPTALQTCESGNLRGWFGYKIAEGGEQTVSFTWSAGNGCCSIAEYEFVPNTLVTPVVSAENVTYISSVLASSTAANFGSVTPANATNLWVGGIAVDLDNLVYDGRSVSNSLATDADMTNTGSRAGNAIYSKKNIAASAFNPTYTHTDTGDEVWLAAAVFEYVASGGSSPLRKIMQYHGG